MEVIQVITDGQRAPADEIQGMRFVFAAEKLTITGPEEGPDEMTFKLDPSQEPPAIDLIDHRTTIFAIYNLDGDTLTIALRDRTAKDRTRPTKFESEKGNAVSVMVLKRC